MNKQLMEQVLFCIREAGRLILNAELDKGVVSKSSRRDLVTKYDRLVQKYLSEQLLKLLPGSDFYGEEDSEDHTHSDACCWIVDPIDGTANFVRGMKRSAVSVGLEENGAIVFGAIYNPYADELFWAVKGEGAFLNGTPIHVSNTVMENALFFMGSSPYYEELHDKTFRLARTLMASCSDYRRSASAALELCDIACGRGDLYFEYLLSPWDYAAGSLLVQEAGGIITDIKGQPLQFREKSGVAVANSNCYHALLRAIAETEKDNSI